MTLRMLVEALVWALLVIWIATCIWRFLCWLVERLQGKKNRDLHP